VEYILVASFDIDRGPIMEHQYPGPISPDENMLAELMLPDQTHVRTQDWTMFFLHKDSGATDEEEDARNARRQRRKEKPSVPNQTLADEEGHESVISSDDGDHSGDEEDVDEGPPLMYVLNLVNTKQDNTVKR
jgi:Docking domain of Afi1 for Arf3 in vesicle trafficking